MAKEESTTIGFNRSTMALIALLITVAGFIAFWKDRGGTQAKAEAVHNSIVSSHETRITANTTDIKEVRTEQHKSELARTKLEGKVDSIGSGVTEIKTDFKEFKQYLMQYDFNKKKDTD